MSEARTGDRVRETKETRIAVSVDLDLAEGTVTGLVGPAEAGKSTLCLVAGGLAPRVVGGTLTGQVGIDGASLRVDELGDERRRRAPDEIVSSPAPVATSSPSSGGVDSRILRMNRTS